MTQRRNEQGDIVGGCVIHHWSMGLCVHCGEAPLGSMPTRSKVDPFTAPDWRLHWERVDPSDWMREAALCMSCDQLWAWVGAITNSHACPACGCGTTLKCLNLKP